MDEKYLFQLHAPEIYNSLSTIPKSQKLWKLRKEKKIL